MFNLAEDFMIMLSLGMCTVWSIWFWHNVGNFKPITLLKAKLSKMGKYLKETKFSKIWTIQNSILDVFQLGCNGCNIDAVYSFLDILTDLDFKKFCPKRSQKVGAAFFKKFGPKCRFPRIEKSKTKSFWREQPTDWGPRVFRCINFEG